MGPGGVYPGLIRADVNYPSLRETPLVRYDFKADDIEILGPVHAVSRSVNVLLLFSNGDNGLGTVIAAAKKQYPDCDTVINLNWDTRYTWFGWPYPPIPILQRATSSIYGTAIKFKAAK